MKKYTNSKEKPTFDDARSQKMYEEAIARPGVREVVRVYGNWGKKNPKKTSSPSTADTA